LKGSGESHRKSQGGATLRIMATAARRGHGEGSVYRDAANGTWVVLSHLIRVRRRSPESSDRWSRQGESLVPAVAAKVCPDLPWGPSSRRWRSPLLRLRALCRDSRQRDIRPRGTSRQHESRLLSQVGNDSHWMRRDMGGCHLARLAPGRFVSYDIELSFLPISRARPAPSATQLSSSRGRRPARRHVHAAWESAEVITQAPWQANFAATSDRSEASETGKPDSLSGRRLTIQIPLCRSEVLSGCKTNIKGVIAKRTGRSEGQTSPTAASDVAYVARPSSAGL
jgi:hypothetical protein